MFRMIMPSKALVALAVAAACAAGSAPAASAEQPMRGFRVVFAYNSADAPQKIYADLQSTAHKACRAQKFSGYYSARAVQVCKARVINAAISAMNRMDIAALHTKRA